MADDAIRQDRILTRKAALWRERASWDPHWKELSANILPRNSRFMVMDRNRGDKRQNQIYDSTATKSLRTLVAGMMAGMTSPARPWFRLSIPDQDLLKYGPVQIWLAETTRMMLRIFATSNTYNVLQTTYKELGCFGTHLILTQDHFDTVIHHTAMTAGEYALACDGFGRVDTAYREFQKPVGAVVKQFGLSNISMRTRQLYDQGSLDEWVTIFHAVEPRGDRDPSKLDARNMAWKSIYFEPDAGTKGKYLRESGYKNFPGLAPRWDLSGQDIYGHSPGMDALGDIKQLQHEQLRKAQGIDYHSKPPMQYPTSMKGQEIDALPGGASYIDAATPSGGAKALFQPTIQLDHLLADIVDVRERIRSSFYADLFLMLATNNQNLRMTATEVAERHEEKLLMLGPVLERLHNELLSPLIDNTFSRMVEAGILPPPPPELEGMDLSVEFVSMLAQAQRAVATNSIDRYAQSLGAIASIKPDVLDNFDADAWNQHYSDMLGVPPELIVTGDKVALVRKQRAEQKAQEQQLAQATVAADAAAKAGTVSTQGGASNAANDIINQFSGYSSPSPAMVQ
jgi:hypothetical protein